MFEMRVTGNVTLPVRVGVAAGAELKPQPILKRLVVFFGDDVAHHVTHHNFHAHGMHSDHNVRII